MVCRHSVCVSVCCWREETEENTTTIISVENEYWYRVKIFSIKLFGEAICSTQGQGACVVKSAVGNLEHHKHIK